MLHIPRSKEYLLHSSALEQLCIARLSGAKIIVADVIEEKLQEALKNGADYVINIVQEDIIEKVKELTAGYGVTVSIDAACVNDSLLTLLKATGNAGRVISLALFYHTV